MFRIALRPAIWLSMNSLLVCTFAFGNVAQRQLERRLVRVGQTALHVQEREEVRGFVVCASNAAEEIVTLPNGDPPLGGSKMPSTR